MLNDMGKATNEPHKTRLMSDSPLITSNTEANIVQFIFFYERKNFVLINV